MKKKITWFFVTNYGRYALGILLTLTGIFFEYITIDFLKSDWRLFEYICMSGVVIIILQFLYHVIVAIVLNAKKKD